MKLNQKRSSFQTVNKSQVRDAKIHATRASKDDDPYIAAVRKALISLQGDIVDGKLLVETVRLTLNEMIGSKFALERDSNKLLAKMLRYIGLQVEPGTRKTAAVFWGADIIFHKSWS